MLIEKSYKNKHKSNVVLKENEKKDFKIGMTSATCLQIFVYLFYAYILTNITIALK